MNSGALVTELLDESESCSVNKTAISEKSGNNMDGNNIDLESIKIAVKMILKAVGDNPDRPGLIETPARVAKMYAEMFAGINGDPGRHLRVTFPENYDEMVVVKDIPFTSMCEHHLLPFTGIAHIAYIPNGRVVGLSKLARVVEDVSKRPQVQERMTQTIADLMDKELKCTGVAVFLQAEHSCMCIRGVKKHGCTTITSVLRGVFKTNLSTRAEVLSLINQKTS
jgi:GTP cyclohydrolase I